MPRANLPACVLSIAGSDPSGAAGSQADLKTFAAFGAHGLTAIAALTAQNTRQHTGARLVPADFLRMQLDTLHADFRIRAVKIGMLGSAANVRAVARWLRERRLRHIVLDPLLVSSSGKPLLAANALAALREELLPLAEVITPNVPEAEALLGAQIDSPTRLREAAGELRALGTRGVLLKGGHLPSTARVRDVYHDGETMREFTHARLPYPARGTGCTLSAAIAAGLAQGLPPLAAVQRAERYLQNAYRRAYRAGRGERRILGHGATGFSPFRA